MNKKGSSGYLYGSKRTDGSKIMNEFFSRNSQRGNRGINGRQGRFEVKTKNRNRNSLDVNKDKGKDYRGSLKMNSVRGEAKKSKRQNSNPLEVGSIIIQRRRSGENATGKGSKVKVFSKSYDRKADRSYKSLRDARNRASRYGTIKSIGRKSNPSMGTKTKIKNHILSVKKRRRSKMNGASNKVFLSHREYLKRREAAYNKKGMGVQFSSGFFKKKKESALRNSARQTPDINRNKPGERKKLPGLNDFVAQVNSDDMGSGLLTKKKVGGSNRSTQPKESQQDNYASFIKKKRKESQNVTKFDQNSNPKFRLSKPRISSQPKTNKLSLALESPANAKMRKVDIPREYYVDELASYNVKSTKPKGYFQDVFKDHFKHTFVSMQFCKTIRQPRKKELADRKVTFHRKPKNLEKKTLVLDLDETLIHCNTNSNSKTDITLPVTFPTGERIQAPINVRPHAKEFLKEMAEIFEVIIFTASHSCYANVVIDHLDPNKEYVSHRLFRETCIQSQAGVFIKDLRVIKGRSLRDMVLVDNASYSFAYQINNGIPIIPFYDSKHDDQLLKLGRYLKELNKASDVRLVNKEHFRLQKIIKSTSQTAAMGALLK